ncbi:MAG: EF2563 family selenium-dependent molybdenum hydroxylase system protein [Desulfobacter sp.]|nr:MAG: EF2563 family selenium-dependent molybdenum hydroxylase system protein [Desulfobacter sp.]
MVSDPQTPPLHAPALQAWDPETDPPRLSQLVIGIKGGGDLATGIAHALFRAGLRRIFIMESPMPTVIRREVAFASAVYTGEIEVEGITARLTPSPQQVPDLWKEDSIPVLADPEWRAVAAVAPHVLVDAVVAKKNLGTQMTDAPLVLGLGPGFTAGEDVHLALETRRGHNLGRLIEKGSPSPNTSMPEAVMGITGDRLLRSPAAGAFTGIAGIGDTVVAGQVLGHVDGVPVEAKINGVIRGLIHDGVTVGPGKKIGDIDPRGKAAYSRTISDKARALGGAVLGAILGRFNR